jgi:hypothetical protein
MTSVVRSELLAEVMRETERVHTGEVVSWRRDAYMHGVSERRALDELARYIVAPGLSADEVRGARRGRV